MSLQTMTTVEVEARAAVLLQMLQQKAAAQGLSLEELLKPLAEATPDNELDSSLASFELRNEADVKQYLQNHSFLMPLLHEAQAQVARFFSPQTKPILEVSHDPSDGASQLFLVIPTQLKAEDAYEQMEKLDVEWWLAASEHAQFRLNIVPEFT
jgi:hypothetical protein